LHVTIALAHSWGSSGVCHPIHGVVHVPVHSTVLIGNGCHHVRIRNTVHSHPLGKIASHVDLLLLELELVLLCSIKLASLHGHAHLVRRSHTLGVLHIALHLCLGNARCAHRHARHVAVSKVSLHSLLRWCARAAIAGPFCPCCRDALAICGGTLFVPPGVPLRCIWFTPFAIPGCTCIWACCRAIICCLAIISCAMCLCFIFSSRSHFIRLNSCGVRVVCLGGAGSCAFRSAAAF